MTSSRPKASTTRAWIILAALLLLTGVANAGRKRVVVLEFEGDKAEKFHEDVVKLIRKSHTVVSIDKWNGAAEEMSATKLSGQNVKKVAKKLKVDGVVSGVVEKRRDEYILRIKLRSGASGELVGSQVNIKSETARLDGTAVKDIKDELIEVISGLESNRDGSASEDEEEKPKKGKKVEEDEEEKPKKSGFGKKKTEDEEEKPKKLAKDEPKGKKTEGEEKPKKGKKTDDEEKPKKGKKTDDEEVVALKTKTEDDNPLPTKKGKTDNEGEGKKKTVALKGDGEEGGEVEGGAEVTMDAAKMYSPGERAVDAVAGLSFTGRRMSFTYDPAQVAGKPAGYKQLAPVPGIFIDATLYPLAIGHKRKDLLKGLGVSVLFDRTFLINSKNPQGTQKLPTTEQRFGLGAVFRYPLNQSATSPVVGGTLGFGKQQFTISGMASIPNVNYSVLEPGAFFNLPLSPQLVFNADLGFMLALDAGQIVTNAQYGTAAITGFEMSLGADYLVTKNIFARAAARLETLGFAFKGNGMKSAGVSGARDTYFGGSVTAGYLF
ncbi:MAG TPA: hypothetical protein VN253_16040 [Kofleriaceae bacterium]|nr:hypothetical protein [Kofleriaceae bacterium]